MKWEVYKVFVKKMDEEMILTEDNILSKSAGLNKLIHDTMDIYSKEIRDLKRVDLERKKVYGDLFKDFKYGSASDYRWENKGEIDTQIQASTEYQKIMQRYNEQEIIVQHLEGILDNVKKMSFQIRNMIEYKKYTLGM